jgi:hypothetical protein
MRNRKWLIFLPQTPTAPSSLRVSVWRRMQQFGALALQNGVWILPHSNALERNLHVLLADLKVRGGEGLIFTTQITQVDLEESIIERFRSEREKDYTEFLDRCTQFLNELEKEATIQKFTFAELEENEVDLHKLTQWLRKIHHRDFFGGPQRAIATTALTRCRQSLEDYAAQVYLLLGHDVPEIPGIDGETP